MFEMLPQINFISTTPIVARQLCVIVQTNEFSEKFSIQLKHLSLNRIWIVFIVQYKESNGLNMDFRLQSPYCNTYKIPNQQKGENC